MSRSVFGFLFFTLLIPSVSAQEKGLNSSIEGVSKEVVKDSLDYFPLPLVGSWNSGESEGGYHPEYQKELIEKNHHLLPWFFLNGPVGKQLPPSYYSTTINFLEKNNLPLSFVSTQWERLLSDEKEYFDLPVSINPNHVTRDSQVVKKVSPFGDTKYWWEVGKRWAETETLRKLQKEYPNPPRVIFISNNEHKKTAFKDIKLELRYQPERGVGFKELAWKQWNERYTALINGFREGLVEKSWKNNSIFIGYNAIISPKLGKYYGWNNASIYRPGHGEPWSKIWGGVSASYYVRPYNKSSDYKVWSPQIEAMNWVFLKEDSIARDPQYWFELSVWDGGKSQRDQYVGLNQKYDSTRYAAMVKFGAWLLRPRVIREFLFWDEKVRDTEANFKDLVRAVDDIHEYELLRNFWRHGRLVANETSKHPYAYNIPLAIANKERWFLLDSSISPRKYTKDDQEIPVFSLALTVGQAPEREWLLYTYSPLRDYDEVLVTIPEYQQVRVNVRRRGDYYHVKETELPRLVAK